MLGGSETYLGTGVDHKIVPVTAKKDIKKPEVMYLMNSGILLNDLVFPFKSIHLFSIFIRYMI